MKIKYKVAQPLLLSIMLTIGMLIGFQLNEQEEGSILRIFPGETDIKTGRVEEVLRYLDAKYLYEPYDSSLTDEMLQQLFTTLDPYSIYIPPSDLKAVNDNMNGNYRGIGIETIFF